MRPGAFVISVTPFLACEVRVTQQCVVGQDLKPRPDPCVCSLSTARDWVVAEKLRPLTPASLKLWMRFLSGG